MFITESERSDSDIPLNKRRKLDTNIIDLQDECTTDLLPNSKVWLRLNRKYLTELEIISGKRLSDKHIQAILKPQFQWITVNFIGNK